MGNENKTFEQQLLESQAKDQAKRASRKNTIKNIIIYGLTGAIIANGAYVLGKNGGFKLPPKQTAQVQTQQQPKWTKEHFESLVIDYMYKNPTVDEAAARHFVAIQYQDELLKNNPELLYEITGIYVQEELTNEAFETLVSNTYRTLRANGIDVTVEDVTKFVAVINIDQLAQDNPELLREIIGTEKASEIITDAFKVTGAIKNRNYDIYQSTKSTKGLIRVSNFIFDKGAQRDLRLIESYVDEANAAKGNRTKQNEIIESLMAEIQLPNGDLSDMEDGIGFASTVAMDCLINYVSFNNNNVRIISNQNLSALLNHDTLELYLSNIYGTINKCDVKKRTK